MRLMRYTFIFCLLCEVISPAMAGISVTSYATVAETNGYAPLSQDQYFVEQDVVNISHSLATVAGDYTGGNSKGSLPTWHWIGSAQTNTVTTVDSNSLTITGSGSFSSALSTTDQFVNPTHNNASLTPGSAADYHLDFVIDMPAKYRLNIDLNHYSNIQLSSVNSDKVILFANFSGLTKSISQAGDLSAGQYEIQANSSLAISQPEDGANDLLSTGSFTNFNFSVQTPEPTLFSSTIAATILATAYRHRFSK